MFRLFRGKREALKKYLLAAFLLIMALGMIGVVTPFFSGGDTSRVEMNVLAEVGDHTITVQDLQRTVQMRLKNTPQGFDSRLVPLLAGSLLDEMVLRYAIEIQARKLGLEVTPEELLEATQRIPWLYSNGSFIGMDAYENQIQQQTGMTVAQFEAELRESLLFDKIRATVTDGMQVSLAEVHEEFVRRNAKTKIEYVLFDPSQFLKAVEVGPQALETFFKKDPERYIVPEQRRVRYVLIQPDLVRARVRLGESELRQYYTQHLSDYRVPERVKVAHILFKTTEKTPAEIATIEKSSQDVLNQVKSGKDFGELAKKYSEDSSASNGGEIGWIVRGQTVKEFENAAFSMKPGLTSGLIKTIYGIHILKVLDKQAAHLQSFDEVKETIRAALEKEKLDAAEQALAQKLEQELKKNPEAFDSVAKREGLEVKETPLFRQDETVPDFGKNESFSDLAFELATGQVGQPITVAKGLAIIRVTEINRQHVPKLEEVRARVEEDYRAEQSKTVASEKAREFAARCKTGDFKKLARAAGHTVKESKDFSQLEYVEGLGSGSQLSAAFTLGPGRTSDVVSLGATSAVFRVVSHTPPNEADFEAQRDRIAEELVERKRSLGFEIFRQNLKQQLVGSKELKLNEQAMKLFLASYERK